MPPPDEPRIVDSGALDHLAFGPAGALDEHVLSQVLELDPASFGTAVMTLVDRAIDMSPDLAEPAAASITALVWTPADGPHAVTLDPAALVNAYRLVAFDPDRTALRDLVLRLLRMLDPDQIRPHLRLDRASFDLRDRLDQAASALPEEGDDSGRRGLPPPTISAPTSAPDDAFAMAPPPPSPGPDTRHDEPKEEAAATYEAYGLLESPERVVAKTEFVLRVGLSSTAQHGVTGAPFDLPDPTTESYRLAVHVIADGFDVRPGESPRISLEIGPGLLYPIETLHLTPRELSADSADLELTAIFSLDGTPIGAAIRKVQVLRSDQVETSPTISAATGANITVPAGEPPADVTLIIKKGVEPGVLRWSLESPLDGVDLPTDEPPTSSIGSDPQQYATNLVRAIQLQGKQDGLAGLLAGYGVEIHDAMPVVVREALAAAHAAVAPHALNVLILTDEPYVPWELAQLDERFDPDAPNHLGSQVNVARWILAPGNMPTIPPDAVQASEMAVIWGVYTSAALPRLLEAEAEAQTLQDDYRAVPVDAVPDKVDQVLNGEPGADILHFAVHGRYDPQGAGDGIYLTTGRPVGPTQIRGSNLRGRAPFVFLNACQVGSGSETLGNYGGIAQAFLRCGASAVVAPLWSVDDVVARSIALDFYNQVLTATASDPGGDATARPAVADLLRQARRKLIRDGEITSATYLAYQFYGHPSLRVTWRPNATGGTPHG